MNQFQNFHFISAIRFIDQIKISIITCLSVLLLILTTIPVCVCAEIQDRFFSDDSVEPWHISADEINYDKKTDQYIAKDNVVITKEDRKLTADFVRFNYNTMEVLAIGHVIMTVGEDVLIGDRMEMDLKAEIGTIHNGTVFLKENHFYIKGNKIKKLGENSYFVDEASLTSCDGENTPWKITGRNLRVTLEGYGFVDHATLWAKKIPLFYTPFLVFPAKQKRQSGLLPPQIGYSKRKWEEYNQPFYWAIDESSDATFYLYHMGRRGDKVAFEYRYVLDDYSKGTMMYDFLKDRKVDDGTQSFEETGVLQSSKEWGYASDSVLRPNTDRYWFRWKHDQAMPFGFFGKLDLDIISDHDYLHEFKNGYTGFKETSTYYTDNFGRDLDEYDDSTRTNSLSINRIWSQYSLNAELRWYDDVIVRRQGNNDTTLQTLPLVEFNASRQQIYKTPFYTDFDSEYTYTYSKDGNRLHRTDLYPRFYLPYNFGNYFTFEPSFGVRETAWYVDDYSDETVETNKTLNRQIYDIKLDLSSGIYKIYNINGKTLDKIKHSIDPQIIYDYTPEQDQEEYPDSIEKSNKVTYSITNTFTSRSKESKEQKNRVVDEENDESVDEENDEPASYIYNEFCRFKIEQSYDIGEARDDNEAMDDNSEPFSPIYAELEFLPAKYLSLRADAEWCQYENSLISHNVGVALSDDRGDRLFVEHRYAFDSSESIYYNINLKVLDSLEVFGEYERNMYDGRDIRSVIGFLYESQCWSIRCFYEDEKESDRSYGFIVSLHGLGEIGTDLLGRHVEGAPGLFGSYGE
ncbi:MAG: LPS assembly protein LptD [Proteobacteria bacterium]|nr:LPS assembly protein LptD [Pseudomonadota bacterium]